MATSVITPVPAQAPAQVTSTDQQSLDARIQALIQQEMARAETERNKTPEGQPSASAPASVPPERPIKVSLGGQSFEFRNEAELSQALEKSFSQYREVLAATTTNAQPQSSNAASTTPETPKFDINRYAQLFTENPATANDYWLNHALFEGRADNPVDQLRAQLNKVTEIERTLTAYQFREAHPEFPGGEQAAVLINGIRQAMDLPWTPQGLEAAWAVALQRGLVPPQSFSQQPPQQQQQPQPPQFQPPQFGTGTQPMAYNYWQPSGQPVAPPAVGRGATDVSPGVNLDNLTTEQIQRIFEQAGVAVMK